LKGGKGKGLPCQKKEIKAAEVPVTKDDNLKKKKKIRARSKRWHQGKREREKI